MFFLFCLLKINLYHCICRRSGNQGTQTCLPAAHRVAPLTAWYDPSSAPTIQDPCEGPSLTRRATPRPPWGCPPGWLPRSGDIYASCTLRGSCDVSHDDQGQAGASGRSVPVSSLVLRRQAQAQGPEESTKGFHMSATRPRPPGRQDGGHRGAHCSVTSRVFCRQRLLLSG